MADRREEEREEMAKQRAFARQQIEAEQQREKTRSTRTAASSAAAVARDAQSDEKKDEGPRVQIPTGENFPPEDELPDPKRPSWYVHKNRLGHLPGTGLVHVLQDMDRQCRADVRVLVEEGQPILRDMPMGELIELSNVEGTAGKESSLKKFIDPKKPDESIEQLACRLAGLPIPNAIPDEPPWLAADTFNKNMSIWCEKIGVDLHACIKETSRDPAAPYPRIELRFVEEMKREVTNRQGHKTGEITKLTVYKMKRAALK